MRLAGPEWLGLIPSNDAADPRPFLLPGVRVRFAPIGVKAARRAREAVAAALGIDADDMIGASDALSAELIRAGVFEWEGVGGVDGEPLPVSPESVALFVDDFGAFEASQAVYVDPWLARDREGNVSAASPSGTGAAATPADDIAPSPAAPTSKGAVTSARTGSTSRRRRTPRSSGTS